MSRRSGANDNFRARLTLNQLLFASGRVYYAHRAAERQVESSRRQEEAVRLQVARRAAEAYLGVLIARSVADVQRQALETARAHLAHVRNRYRAGAATRLELYRAEVADLRTVLEREGLEVEALEEVRPTFEDVFLSRQEEGKR